MADVLGQICALGAAAGEPMPALLHRHHDLVDLLIEGGRVPALRILPQTNDDLVLDHAALWWVRHGLVRRYRVGERRVLVDLHGPGAVVCRDEAEASAGSEALVATPGTRLVEFELSSLADIARQHPEATTLLVTGLAHHQSRLRRRLSIRSNEGEARLTQLLEILASEIGLPCRHGRPGWLDVHGLTHQDLADLFNATRPYVTGLVSRLEASGRLARPHPRHLCVLTGRGAIRESTIADS